VAREKKFCLRLSEEEWTEMNLVANRDGFRYVSDLLRAGYQLWKTTGETGGLPTLEDMHYSRLRAAQETRRYRTESEMEVDL
jgi:hypothetical protein